MVAPRRLACAVATAMALWGASTHADVGDTTDSLPGVVRVPALSPSTRGLAVAASAGYGVTEGVIGNGDSYARAQGALSVSYQPTSFLAAALRFDGRYDVDTGAQSASGATGYPTLELRMMTPVGDALSVGGQLDLAAPGRAAPSFEWRALTPDASLLATYAPPDSRLTLTSRLGFRWDNSAQSVPNANLLALPDRVELGISQASAVLTGLGVAYRVVPRVELLGDVTWDLLVGKSAPSVVDAPILVSAGTRATLDVDGKLQFLLVVTTSPSGRPTVSATAPLVDVEPRVTALVGLVFRPFAERPPPPVPVVGPPPPPGGPGSQLPAARVTLAGRALSEDGHTPLVHAQVVVTRAGTSEKQETQTDEQGRFAVDGLEPGEVTVTISATRYQPVKKTVTISGTPAPLDILAPHALPAGEVRGVVRDLAGKPVKATVRLEPGGVEVPVAPDGTFRSDVQPGAYDVVIRAPGYADQKRHVNVERDAVILLNVELRRQAR